MIICGKLARPETFRAFPDEASFASHLPSFLSETIGRFSFVVTIPNVTDVWLTGITDKLGHDIAYTTEKEAALQVERLGKYFPPRQVYNVKLSVPSPDRPDILNYIERALQSKGNDSL